MGNGGIQCKQRREFGHVYRERIQGTEDVVAVKRILLRGDSNGIKSKIQQLLPFDSPYLVRYYASLSVSDELWVYMEGVCKENRLRRSIVIVNRLQIL